MARPGASMGTYWRQMAWLVATDRESAWIATRRGTAAATPGGGRQCRSAHRTERAFPAPLPGIGAGRTSGSFSRRAARTRCVGGERSSLQVGRLARTAILRVREAGLSALRGIPDRTGGTRTAVRNRQAPPRVRDAAISRRNRTQQFSGDEPGRPRQGGRNGRREPRTGPSQPGRRCAEGAHHDERRNSIRRREKPGDDARQRRLPQ